MASLYITEFSGVQAIGAAVTQAPKEPPQAEQKVAFTLSTASQPFGSSTEMVQIMVDANAHIAFSHDGAVATAASRFIPAFSASFHAVKPGMTVAALLA